MSFWYKIFIYPLELIYKSIHQPCASCAGNAPNKAQDGMVENIISFFTKRIRPFLTEITLPFTFFVIVPFNFYIQNNNQIHATFLQMFPWLMIASAVGSLCIILIERVLGSMNEKAPFLFKALLCGILICLIVQAFFTNVDYGLFNGADIDWNKYKNVAVWNTAGWLIICFSIFIFLNRNKEYITGITEYALTVVMAISFFNYITTPMFNKKTTFFSDEHLYEVSKNKNMIVLILDSFDTDVFKELLKKFPENNKKLSGFTYYPDIAGSYPTTAGALPQIITGKYYKNDVMYDKYIDESYINNEFFDLIRNDYDIDIYTFPYFSSTYAIARNLEKGKVFVKDKLMFFLEYTGISFFKTLPHILKKYISIDPWTGLRSFGRKSKSNGFNEQNIIFISNLKKNGLTAVSDKNSFKIIHLNGAHPPFDMDRNFNRVDRRKNTVYEHSQAALNMAYLYIEHLKKAGVYDKTTLIIMADHGINQLMTNPLMLIKSEKDKGRNELKTDNRPVSFKNLHATFADLMGLPYQKFGSPFRLADKTDKRFFYWYHWDDRWKAMAYFPTISEYEIAGNVADHKSWKQTGRVYTNIENDNSYKIGKTIFFGDRKSYAYINAGVMLHKDFGFWTEEKEVAMKMRVKKGKNKKLLLNITASPYLGRTLKEVAVNVLANGREIAEWHIAEKNVYQAEIPADIMSTDDLNLTFRFSYPVIPASEDLDDETAELGIFFHDMVIKE